MTFDELIKHLYPEETKRPVESMWLEKAREIVRGYLCKQEAIRVYFASAPGCGHQAHTVFFMKRLVLDNTYHGRFELICADEETQEKLKQLIPGFHSESRFSFMDCETIVCSPKPSEPVEVVICGGLDKDKDKEEETDLCQEANAKFALCLQPYNWPATSFLAGGGKRMEYPELKQAPEFLYSAMMKIPDDLWKEYPNLDPLKKLLYAHDQERLLLWPIYGLHAYDYYCNESSTPLVLLSLAFSALQYLNRGTSSPPLVMVLLNYDDCELTSPEESLNWKWHTLLSLLDDRDGKGPPVNLDKDLAYLINYYLYGIKSTELDAHAKALHVILVEGITTWFKDMKLDGVKRLETLHLLARTDTLEKLQLNHLYLFPLGGVPQPAFYELFDQSNFPVFFEGQSTTPLAMRLGRPYLQPPVHNVSVSSYPKVSESSSSSPSSSQHPADYIFDLVSQLPRGVNQLLSYTVEGKKNADALLAIWKKLEDFFLAYSLKETKLTEYFTHLHEMSMDFRYDKFMLGLMHLYLEANPPSKALGLVNSRFPQPLNWPLEEVCSTLRAAAERGALDLSKLLPDSYFSTYAALMAAGGPFSVRAAPEQIVAEYKGELLAGVQVIGAQADLPCGSFACTLCFTLQEGWLHTALVCSAPGRASFQALPWLVLEEPGFQIRAREGLFPPERVLTGTLAGTRLHVEMTDFWEEGWVVRGRFPEPEPDMNAVFALAGGIDFLAGLPEPLRALGGFGMTQIEASINRGGRQVHSLHVFLETARAWQFCAGVPISFLPNVEVRVRNPQDLKGRAVSLVIGGNLSLGGGMIDVRGSFPDLRLEAYLSQGAVDLSELAMLFSLDLKLKTLVTDFRFTVLPEISYYHLTLALQTGWEFFGLFTVTGIGVTVTSQGEDRALWLKGALRFLPESGPPLDLAVHAAYGGGHWQFRAVQTVSQTVSLGDVLAHYTEKTLSLSAADGEKDVELCRLEVSYSTGSEDFCISAQTSKPWEIPFLNLSVAAGAYVGRGAGAYYARIQAGVEWNHIPLTVWYDYSQSGPYRHSFGLTWDALTGTISKDASGAWVGTLAIAPGTTLGGIVAHMLTWCTGAPFALDAPWNLLGSIPLPACALIYQFKTKAVSLDVNIGPIELGFCTVEGVSLSYQSGRANPEENGVMISLVGSFVWNTGNDAVGDQHHLGPWNAAEPGSAPAPGGQGNKYLDLRLMALGQHAHIFDAPVKNVTDAIERLYQLAPPEEGALPPVRYDPGHGWLAGADLGILRENEGAGYLVNLQLIFSDPDLYALRVRLEGTAAKVFKGLDFQVLYRKISDTIGVFQAEVTLPDRMRYLSIGAYSLTLPVFGFAVYTNGDFQIDVGFPWNRDFSRSLSIEGILYPGIPFTGAAGFYFGKLSAATAGDLVPRADNGLFNPVLSFGLGISIGIGKSIHYGVLSGGFSITAYGILEGVIAKWNPYTLPEQPDGNLQSSYYFSIHGTVGLAGRLFGAIDFCIIKASVNIGIDVYVDFLFGSYQDTVLSLCASFSASASLTINFGLFKIHISFSFSIKIKETLTIRSTGQAPWRLAGETVRDGVLRAPGRLRALHGAAPAVSWDHMLLPEPEKRTLPGYLLAAPAAAGDEWGDGPAVPCAAVLLSLDASDGCFGALCDALARWCVCCTLGRDMTAREVDASILSAAEAEGAAQALEAFSRGLKPLPSKLLDTLLSGQFRLQITQTNLLVAMGEAGETAQGAFFPMPPALCMKVTGAAAETEYTFGGYNRLSNEALARLRVLFDRLAVQFEEDQSEKRMSREPEVVSVASWVFSDYFLLLCRQMVRALRDALRNLKYPLDDGQSCRDILDWVNVRRSPGESVSYTLYDLFASNQDHPFTPGKTLSVLGALYKTVEGDTPALVAGRLGVDLASLADGPGGEANAALRGLFSRSGGAALDLPHLGSFRVHELLVEARRAGIYGKLSGMASRYYLHGLRLPTEGITPLSDGMWVRGGALPPEAGLFALTGQLVPVPAPCGRAVTLSFSHGPDWLELPEDYALAIEPGSMDARRLEALKDFLAKRSLSLPCELLEETTFRPAVWAFSPPAALGEDKKLWTLPAALLNLSSSVLRPILNLTLERYDEATGEQRGVPLTSFRYAALCSFRVSRTGTPGLYTVSCGSKQAPRRLERLLEACQAAPGLIAALAPVYHTVDGYGCDPTEKTSFDLVQTDLSTETHPPVDLADGKADSMELLELLWQALVTNNGGTFLRYWNTETGAGLPEKIFSDGGDAELAFLAVLASDGGHIPVFCDCVVSGMAVPAGTNLYAVCTEQIVTVPYRDEAPARLAADYLASVTDMARRNAAPILREGSRWTIDGALYPASAGAAPGLALAAVASYFGVSVQALREANTWKQDWNTPFREGDSVLIPPFTVKAGPAETLAALAGRCFLPAPTLLWQNRESTGLFRSGQSLILNACPGSWYGAVTPGCVDVAYQRCRPGDVPSDPAEEGYALAHLTNSFTLLRYRAEETPWFPASGGSAPVGPDENWRYGVSFPAASYAGKSAYGVVCSVARLGFEWLDTYGNRLPAGTNTLGCLRLIGYTDSLLPLSRWPSCAASWRVAGDGAQPALIISLSFSPQRYHTSGAEGAEEAGQDLTVYETAAAQLTDPNGLDLTLRTSLLQSGGSPFSDGVRQSLMEYLACIRAFLSLRAAGEDAQPPEPTQELPFELSPKGLCRETLFQVEVSILMRRSGPPMAGCEEVPQVTEAETVLSPDSIDLPAFARAFETAFPYFSLTASANDSAGGLWVVRRQEMSGDGGLAFAFDTQGKSPILYAPRPVSNRLESRTGVSVYRYTPGRLLSEEDVELLSFQDVDLDVWLKELIQAMDGAFAPERAAAARLLDRIRGEDTYQALTQAKRALAEALSTLLVPIYDGQEPLFAETARESFRQRLLSDLGQLYNVRAVALYRAEVSSDLPYPGGVYPRIYGALDFQTEEGAAVEFTPAKLTLGPGREQVMAVTLQAPGVVRGEGGAILPRLTLAAGYQPTHLEYDIRRPEGLGGYEDSGWLSLLRPKGYRRNLGVTKIPLPLASYPQSPTLPLQECMAGDGLWTWRYRFDYALDIHYPQSTLHCTVRFNEAESVRGRESGGLFQALARCHAVCGALSRDIAANAPAIRETIGPDSPEAQIFSAALRSLALVGGEAAGAIRLEGGMGSERQRAAGLETLSFTIRECVGESGELIIHSEGTADVQVLVAPERYDLEPMEDGGFRYRDRVTAVLLSAAQGQAIPQRTVLLPQESLFRRQSARASLYAEQNRNLVPDRTLSDCFIFRTGEVTFPEPCFPLREISEDLDLSHYLGRPGTIRAHLDAFLTSLPQELDALVQLQVSHYHYLREGLPPVEVPIFLQTPVRLTAGNRATLATAWSERVSAWRRRCFDRLDWRQDEGLRLELTLLSRLTREPAPMLILKNCILTGEMLRRDPI